MSNPTELLNCPFCGGDAQTDFIEGESYLIECYACRAETGIKDSEEDAIAAWNRRAQPEGEAPQAERGECEHCHTERPLHLLTCPISVKGMAEGKKKEAPEPLRQLLIDFSNNTYFCGLHLNDDAKYAGYLKDAEVAEQAIIELFGSKASPLCGAQHAESGKEVQRFTNNGDGVMLPNPDGVWCYYQDALAAQLDGGQEGSESNG